LAQTLRKIPSGHRILDAGAGEQPFKSICSHLTYVSQDFGQYSPENTNAGLQMGKWDYGRLDIISDIASIPEPDQSFDAILCTEVLEHIINPREAIKEFSRLLKKDGLMILTAPFCSLTHFAPYHYYTGFNRFFYEKELIENGFEVIEMVTNGNYFEFLAQELQRTEYIAKKYSKNSFGRKEKFAQKVIIHALQRFSNADSNSSELLNFGIQILARKK